MATTVAPVDRRRVEDHFSPSTLKPSADRVSDHGSVEAPVRAKVRDGVDRVLVQKASTLSERSPGLAVSQKALAHTLGREPTEVVIGTKSGVMASGGSEPPRRPGGGELPKGHYVDVGDLPVKSLVGIRMADPRGPSRFVDPATRSESDEATRALALRQTTAARNTLYHPDDTLKRELSVAAGRLHGMVSRLDDEHRAALGARILGSEGLLPRQPPSALLATLSRVAHDQVDGQATAHDRAVVIALMGDIGALYADTGATTGVEGRSLQQAAHLRQHIAHDADTHGMQSLTPQGVHHVQAIGGSSAVGPGKKAERTRPENDKPPRSGIHNLGHEADVDLNIPDRQTLPTSRWDVAQIRRDRVNGTQEPLVGHMSGSPAEILQVWDMLRGLPRAQHFSGVLDTHQALGPNRAPMAHLSRDEQNQQIARAAGAAAFLVGMGYHSAVECAEGVLAYTGQNARSAMHGRQDAGHLLGQGAATDLLTDLFAGSTSRQHRMPDDSSLK